VTVDVSGTAEEEEAIEEMDDSDIAHAAETHACARERASKTYTLKQGTPGSGQGNTAKAVKRKGLQTEKDFNAKLNKP
jgi:hypothetical protein